MLFQIRRSIEEFVEAYIRFRLWVEEEAAEKSAGKSNFWKNREKRGKAFLPPPPPFVKSERKRK